MPEHFAYIGLNADIGSKRARHRCGRRQNRSHPWLPPLRTHCAGSRIDRQTFRVVMQLRSGVLGLRHRCRLPINGHATEITHRSTCKEIECCCILSECRYPGLLEICGFQDRRLCRACCIGTTGLAVVWGTVSRPEDRVQATPVETPGDQAWRERRGRVDLFTSSVRGRSAHPTDGWLTVRAERKVQGCTELAADGGGSSPLRLGPAMRNRTKTDWRCVALQQDSGG